MIAAQMEIKKQCQTLSQVLLWSSANSTWNFIVWIWTSVQDFSSHVSEIAVQLYTWDDRRSNSDFHQDFSLVPLCCKEAITFSATSGPFWVTDTKKCELLWKHTLSYSNNIPQMLFQLSVSEQTNFTLNNNVYLRAPSMHCSMDKSIINTKKSYSPMFQKLFDGFSFIDTFDWLMFARSGAGNEKSWQVMDARMNAWMRDVSYNIRSGGKYRVSSVFWQRNIPCEWKTGVSRFMIVALKEREKVWVQFLLFSTVFQF